MAVGCTHHIVQSATWKTMKKVSIFICILIGLIYIQQSKYIQPQKTKEEMDREETLALCNSKEGCLAKNPNAHADWISFSDSNVIPIKGKRPILEKDNNENEEFRIFLFAILAADTNPILLEHFFNHYIKIGLKPQHFLIVLSDEKGILKKEGINHPILLLLKKYHFIGYYYWDEFWSNNNMAIIREKILNQVLKQGIMRDIDWLLEPDADELQIYPEKNLPLFLKKCDNVGINVLYGIWRDRVSQDGHLIDVKSPIGDSIQTHLSNQMPLMCALRTAGKILARRCSIKVSDGKHSIIGKPKNMEIIYLKEMLSVMHYKWVNGVIERLQHKVRMANSQGRLDYRSLEIIEHIESHDLSLDVKTFLDEGICCQSETLITSSSSSSNNEDIMNDFPCDPSTLVPKKSWGYHDATAPWEDDKTIKSVKLNTKSAKSSF